MHHLVNAGARQTHEAAAEKTEGGLFTEGARRAEIGHSRGSFQRSAGGHDFAPYRCHAAVVQRSLVHSLQAIDDLGFALGAEDHRPFAFLELADLQGQTGPPIQQAQ